MNDYVSERARSESFLAPKPKTRFFLARGGGVVTYSEVDEDDWEIRKVRVDSAVVAYINPVQGIGDLQLTNINAVTESQEISDCEFEEQWDRAQFASRSEEE